MYVGQGLQRELSFRSSFGVMSAFDPKRTFFAFTCYLTGVCIEVFIVGIARRGC
jgi:hypothetical protein